MKECPVYAMADENTLKYFTEKQSEIFQEENFDGKHGLMVYNKTIQKTGKAKKQRDIADWIVAVGKHKGFISGNTWVQTQNLLDMNAERRYRKPVVNTSLLSGVIFCNDCGSFMRPKLNYRIYDDGTRSFSYMCELKEKSRCKKCNSKNIMGIEFDKQVLEIIKSITSENGETYKKIKTMAIGEFQGANANEDEIQTLQNTKKQNEKTIAKLIQKIALVDGGIVEELTEEIKRLKSANLEIEKSLSKLTDTQANNQQQVEYAKLVLDIFDTYFQSFDELDLVTKRTLIRLIIDSVEVDGENIYINLAGSDKNNPNQKILSLPELRSK